MRHAFRIADVQHRVARAAKFHPLKPAGQKTGMPLPGGDRLLLPELAGGDHDDETGQIFGFCPKAVQQPRTHRRPAGDHRAGVHERVSRIVIDRIGVQRPDDAHIVGTFFAEHRPDFAIDCPDWPHCLNGCCGAKQLSFCP